MTRQLRLLVSIQTSKFRAIGPQTSQGSPSFPCRSLLSRKHRKKTETKGAQVPTFIVTHSVPMVGDLLSVKRVLNWDTADKVRLTSEGSPPEPHEMTLASIVPAKLVFAEVQAPRTATRVPHVCEDQPYPLVLRPNRRTKSRLVPD